MRRARRLAGGGSTFERRYLSGDELYGDDFDAGSVAGWYEAEREGYASLGFEAADGSAAKYGYHNFNQRHLFRHVPPGPLGDALGLGSAYGGEFLPIVDRLTSLTILEPSKTLRAAMLQDTPIDYVDPHPSGIMPFDDARFDLAVAFGVLHHIPNVSTVVKEMARVVRPGGLALVREPIHSMGDWRAPRPGLTVHERGIPRPILTALFATAFDTLHATLCDFPLRARLPNPDSRHSVLLDEALSQLFAWNYRYHATKGWHKVRPRALALVLRRK